MTRNYLVPVLIALVALTAAILGHGGLGGQPAEAATATAVGIDADPTGNTATTLGTIQSCRRVEVGQYFSVDIYVQGVSGGISGFSAMILYNGPSGVLRIPTVSQGGTDTDVNLLLANASGSNVVNQSDPLPGVLDASGQYTAAATDQGGPGAAESGDGVLARVTFRALSSGRSSLLLAIPNNSPYLTGGDGLPIQPADAFGVYTGTVTGAHIYVGEDCPGSNNAPTAGSMTVPTAEDTQVTVTLTATDTEGICPLSFAITSAAVNGTLGSLIPGPCISTKPSSASATVTFVPDSNICAPDEGSFQYTASDGLSTSTAATATISITCVNDPPTASPASDSTLEDTPVTVTVTATDIENQCPLTFSTASSPLRGSVGSFFNDTCAFDDPVPGTSTATAQITYTPSPDLSGPDSFAYRAQDPSAGSSNLATVSIDVTAVNDPPVADPKAAATDWNSPVVITLTANDVDGDCPLTFSTVGLPSGGTLTGLTHLGCSAGSASAAITYNPGVTHVGPDSFTYKARDPSLADSNIATVSLTVNATDNDADGLMDHLESASNCTPGNADTDSEGLTDGQEVILLGTSCDVADTDSDGFSDAFEMTMTGTSTGASSTTLVDADSSYPQPPASPNSIWATDQWAGFLVTITAGTGAGQTRLIVSNSADTLNIDSGDPWTTDPTASTYAIHKVGTLPLAACAADATANNEDPDALPPDLNDDQSVDILDIIDTQAGLFAGWGATLGDASYSARSDLNADQSIDILDVFVMFDSWGERCTP